jgi:DNA-binding response OmpR family regulator
MKILIAEDSLTSRNLLTTLLKKFGYEVEASVDGAQAWAALQRPDAPQLAILDWMMPEMDGVAVCRCVRQIQTDQPPYLILLTALDDKSHVVAGLEAGADDYIAKPFDADELRARIEVGMRVVTLQRELAAKIRELQEAARQIKTLSGIVPICASCKKVRDDQGFWSQVEAYVSEHSEARFSHGLCPECRNRMMSEFDEIKTGSPGAKGKKT